MQRVTVTIDDDLLQEIDALCARRGYQSRSEALRDIVRSEFARPDPARDEGRDPHEVCHAVLTYVYDHETRALASRLTSNHHHHSNLSISTTHVHVDPCNCLEISILRGPLDQLRAFADSVTSQRGVRHGAFHVIPAERRAAEPHRHPHHHGHGHTHDEDGHHH